MLLFLYQRGADFRHTPHGSPQTIPIYGRNLRPLGAAPIIGIAHILMVVIVRLLSNYVCIPFGTRCKDKQNLRDNKQ